MVHLLFINGRSRPLREVVMPHRHALREAGLAEESAEAELAASIADYYRHAITEAVNQATIELVARLSGPAAPAAKPKRPRPAYLRLVHRAGDSVAALLASTFLLTFTGHRFGVEFAHMLGRLFA